jgi:hypothetical protein
MPYVWVRIACGEERNLMTGFWFLAVVGRGSGDNPSSIGDVTNEQEFLECEN